ncbi:MAG: hypothetical protein AABZ06_02160 [Bdellovibrionota bacterium]
MEADLEKVIRKLAAAHRKGDLQHHHYVDGSAPQPLNLFIDELVEKLQRTLSDSDQIEFGPYRSIFRADSKTPIPDQILLAKTKAGILVEQMADRMDCEDLLFFSYKGSPLLKKFPELAKLMDQDLLIPAAHFKRTTGDTLDVEYKGHVIELSRIIPRSLNSRFVAQIKSGNQGNLKFRLSPNNIILISKYQQPLLEAVEFGPPFRADDVFKRLKDGSKLTMLTRNNYSELQKMMVTGFFNNIERVEIYRSQMQDGYIAYSVEELPSITKRDENVGFVKTRLFHSDIELNESQAKFKHADSSLLVYKLETYRDRLAANLPAKVKAQGHIKLYRVEDCTLDTWMDLFNLSFPRNELIYEYFNSEKVPVLQRAAERDQISATGAGGREDGT